MTDDPAFGADDVAPNLYVGERLKKLRFRMTDNNLDAETHLAFLAAQQDSVFKLDSEGLLKPMRDGSPLALNLRERTGMLFERLRTAVLRKNSVCVVKTPDFTRNQ